MTSWLFCQPDTTKQPVLAISNPRRASTTSHHTVITHLPPTHHTKTIRMTLVSTLYFWSQAGVQIARGEPQSLTNEAYKSQQCSAFILSKSWKCLVVARKNAVRQKTAHAAKDARHRKDALAVTVSADAPSVRVNAARNAAARRPTRKLLIQSRRSSAVRTRVLAIVRSWTRIYLEIKNWVGPLVVD